MISLGVATMKLAQSTFYGVIFFTDFDCQELIQIMYT